MYITILISRVFSVTIETELKNIHLWIQHYKTDFSCHCYFSSKIILNSFHFSAPEVAHYCLIVPAAAYFLCDILFDSLELVLHRLVGKWAPVCVWPPRKANQFSSAWYLHDDRKKSVTILVSVI